MKTLYVLRHAKTEIGAINGEDYDRELTERGHRNAVDLGRFMLQNNWIPDVALSSSAARTRQTIENINDQFPSAIYVNYIDNLYLAPAGDVFREAEEIDDKHESAIIVGHNPGLHEFCMTAVKDGESAALRECSMHFPTCAFVIIKAEITSWKDLQPDCGYLEAYYNRHMVTAELQAA